MIKRADKRKLSDNCCLCQNERSTKKNSHIIPKFMGKVLFENNDKRQIFGVTAKNIDKPFIYQDTAKEDYIFCPSCESYLSVLEGYFAQQIHNLIKSNRGPVYFESLFDNVGSQFLKTKLVEPRLVYLLIDSILFRCHIASIFPFERFLIDKNLLEKIRLQLLRFKGNNTNEIFTTLNQNSDFEYRTFMLGTPLNWSESVSAARVNVNSNTNPVIILTGFYLIMIHLNEQKPREQVYLNNGLTGIKITLMPDSFWNMIPDTILRQLIKRIPKV
ncbi:hypothetical protein L0657_00380 [Dyadobacter sp. CY345]|uniref:hypothetical protein n=1 Tax=Dyadobacter sp. CY345 TaxID=2909335 RepID=UPI001F3F198E|nr:hypothetical protein [Dyadobacter sp. CY345]MCF2442390.1 hypothetical protein [Dyadobacter sp. CY345]